MYRSKYKQFFTQSERISVVQSIMTLVAAAYGKNPGDLNLSDKLTMDLSPTDSPHEVPTDIKARIHTVQDFVEYGFDATYIQSQMNEILGQGKPKKPGKGKK